MCLLKTTILEAELEKVPIVNEKGTIEAGSNKFNIGIRIRLAPPPQIALTQNAAIVAKNNKKIFPIIIKSLEKYVYEIG